MTTSFIVPQRHIQKSGHIVHSPPVLNQNAVPQTLLMHGGHENTGLQNHCGMRRCSHAPNRPKIIAG